MIDTSNYAGEGIPRQSTAEDRRKSERFDCDGFAEIVGAEIGFLFRGEIQNLSQTGCYIATRAQLKLRLLTEVHLHFSVDGAHYHTYARIMAIRPGSGAGFEFLEADTKVQSNIAQLLLKLSDEQLEKMARQTAPVPENVKS